MNTPEIVTERLILRKFTANDPDALKHNNIPVGYVKADLDDSHDSGDGLCKEFRHKGIDVNNIRSGNVMKRLGMTYRYSYEEQWQPKNFPVTFRMYQLNLNVEKEYIYRKYWDISDVRFVEGGKSCLNGLTGF